MDRFSQVLESAIDYFCRGGVGGGGGDDDTPSSTPDDILDLERELAEAKKDGSEDRINKSTMRLSCALVYSRNRADRERGIAMLEASLTNSGRVFQKHQMLYLLAFGYYRSGDYPTTMRKLGLCLEIEPNWGEALSLKNTIEEQCAQSSHLLAVRYCRAVEYYENGDYPTSMRNLDLCLEVCHPFPLSKFLETVFIDYYVRTESSFFVYLIAPNWGEALSLKKTIEERSSYGWTDIGIAVGGIAVVGGIAAVYGTGVVGGMAASVAVRRGLVYAAAAASGIFVTKKMAASASASASSPMEN